MAFAGQPFVDVKLEHEVHASGGADGDVFGSTAEKAVAADSLPELAFVGAYVADEALGADVAAVVLGGEGHLIGPLERGHILLVN